MSQKCCAAIGLITATVLFVSLSSCGRDMQLSTIAIQPPIETFGATNIPVDLDAGLSVQLRAMGNYIQPPVTKDITNQVTWVSNDTQMVTVTSTGLLTATGLTCGNSLVSATITTNHSSMGAIVTGYMTANVVCFTGTGPTLTVNFAGTGAGTVSSSPGGLGCSTTCTASFPSGTTVTLTATPNGSTFGGWAGCDTMPGQTCIVNNLTANRTVTVTFK
jgi:Divergent InlB B-repeat domain/Bacterial Ig-like domain (group 2)